MLISNKCSTLPFPWRSAVRYNDKLVRFEFSHRVDEAGLQPRCTGQPHINLPLSMAGMLLNKSLPRKAIEPILMRLTTYLQESGVKVEKGERKSDYLTVVFGIMLDLSYRANKGYYVLSCVASEQSGYFGAEVYCRRIDSNITSQVELIDAALYQTLASCDRVVT